MLTSTTSRPVICSMEPITLRRIARASSTIATPYSTTMVRSTAAWRSPTSTATPWLLLARAPGMRSRTAPIARAAPLPKPSTPLTCRVASPAIFDTTVSAIVVLPWLVSRSLPRPAAVAGARVDAVASLRGVCGLLEPAAPLAAETPLGVVISYRSPSDTGRWCPGCWANLPGAASVSWGATTREIPGASGPHMIECNCNVICVTILVPRRPGALLAASRTSSLRGARDRPSAERALPQHSAPPRSQWKGPVRGAQGRAGGGWRTRLRGSPACGGPYGGFCGNSDPRWFGRCVGRGRPTRTLL